MIKIYINSQKDDEVEFKTVDFAEVDYDKLDSKYVQKTELSELDQKYLKRDEYKEFDPTELDDKYLLKAEYNPINVDELDQKYLLKSEYKNVDTTELENVNINNFATKKEIEEINEYLYKLKNIALDYYAPDANGADGDLEHVEETEDVAVIAKDIMEFVFPQSLKLMPIEDRVENILDLLHKSWKIDKTIDWVLDNKFGNLALHIRITKLEEKIAKLEEKEQANE